jgi:hypothetical protein
MPLSRDRREKPLSPDVAIWHCSSRPCTARKRCGVCEAGKDASACAEPPRRSSGRLKFSSSSGPCAARHTLIRRWSVRSCPGSYRSGYFSTRGSKTVLIEDARLLLPRSGAVAATKFSTSSRRRAPHAQHPRATSLVSSAGRPSLCHRASTAVVPAPPANVRAVQHDARAHGPHRPEAGVQGGTEDQPGSPPSRQHRKGPSPPRLRGKTEIRTGLERLIASRREKRSAA